MTDSAELPERTTFVALGVVARPQGVRGELRVHRYNPASDLLLEVDRLLLASDPGFSLVEVQSARLGPKGIVVMRFQSVTTVEEADALRGLEVGLERKDLPPPEEGEWYHVDLIGLCVHEEEQVVGKVLRIAMYPTVECLVVGLTDGPEVEIPMVDPFLVKVDLDLGHVDVLGVAGFKDTPPDAEH